MEIVEIVLRVLAAVAVVATVRLVLTDGYGSTPAPRSHHVWDEVDRLR